MRPHSEINQRGVARVEHSLKMLESCVEVSNLHGVHREWKIGIAEVIV